MTENFFTEEGRTRLRNFTLRLRGYFTGCALVGLLLGGFVWWCWLSPLERTYLGSFVSASVWSRLVPGGGSRYTLLAYDWQGKAVLASSESEARAKGATWRRMDLNETQAEILFQQFYRCGLLRLFAAPLIFALILAIGGTVAVARIDQRVNERWERGKRIRGSRLVKPSKYERDHQDADGLALDVHPVAGKGTARLRMKRSEEAQGLLVLGDIGSGKSQIFHRYLAQLARREGETVIIYDPAGEFTEAHYRPERGDVILNPLDERAPFWTPTAEIKYQTDYLSVAECFFPSPHFAKESDRFFAEAGREIFARMLEERPSLSQLIKWCGDPKRIDEVCRETELAHYIDKLAGEMRGGVLATLGRVVKTLRILPRVEDCGRDFSLTQWSEARRGWLFLTVAREAEEQLRPLYTAYLDILMRRLMNGLGADRPVKFLVDELHTLDYLPSLYRAVTEGRKYRVCVFQGTQNKSQYDQRYREDAATMLSCPRHKIILRCSEPESSRWLSNLLGEEEREKPRPSVTASVADQGRDSMSYAIETRNRAVVSREEIAGLPDLRGYWRYGDSVVPFRLDFVERERLAPGFIPRRASSPVRAAIAQVVPDKTSSEPCAAD